MKRILLAVLLVLGLGVVMPGVAHANPNLSKGSSCGLHFGKVLRRDSGGTVFRMRIGPRMYHSGGDMICRGHVRKRGAKSATDTCCSINWQPFALPNWRIFFNGRVAVTGFETVLTAQGCKAFGTELAATLITGGGATPSLVIGGAGCAWGVYKLGQQLPDGQNSLKGMRLIH